MVVLQRGEVYNITTVNDKVITASRQYGRRFRIPLRSTVGKAAPFQVLRTRRRSTMAAMPLRQTHIAKATC